MAATHPWHYLENTILNVTSKSYRAMVKIANYTLGILLASTNLTIEALGTALEPFVTDFIAKYNAWISQLGTQIGDTSALYIELQLISSTKARNWDVRILAVWDKVNPLYKAALPHKRKGLQSGTQEQIIAYLTNISTKLVGVIALSAVKTDIDAHLLILNNAYTAQKAAIGGTKITSADVEASRVELAIQLYLVLANLMVIFFRTPLSVAPFFDISTIRNIEQTIWSRAAKAMTTAYVFTRTLLATDNLRLVNLGLEPLEFAFVANKTDAMPAIGTTTIMPLSRSEEHTS